MIQRQKGSRRKVVAGIVTFSLIFLPTSYAGDATPITAAAPPQGPVIVAPTPQGPAPATKAADNTLPNPNAPPPGPLTLVAPPPAITISRYQVATSPDGNKNLTITVDQDNNATVVWNSKTYTGTFDPTTKNIIIRSPNGDSNTYWIFHFITETNGNNYLYSFDSKTRTSLTQSNTTTYTFFDNGLLSRQSWTAQSGTQGTQYTGGDTSYTYTQINGNPFITSIISGSYQMLGYYHYDSKVFYSYDSSGNTINTTEIRMNGGSATFHYAVWQGSKKTEAYRYGDTDHFALLWQLLNSAGDYGAIDKYVNEKREYYYVTGTTPPTADKLKLQYFIEYGKDLSGVFAPGLVAVQKAPYQWQSYIVQGLPDVLSGETNDILYNQITCFVGTPCQTIQDTGVGNWQVLFGESYDSQGHYLGFGFEFFNHWYPAPPVAAAFANYPKTDTVTLDGKLYKITVDNQGMIKLYRTYNNVYLDGQTYTVTDLSGPNDSLRVRVTDSLGNSFLSNVDWSSSTTYRYALVPINVNGKTYIIQKTMATDQVIMSKTLQTQIDGRSYIISPLASDDVNGRYQVRDITSSYPGNASGVSAPYIVTLGNSNRQYQIQTDSKGNIFLIDLLTQQTVNSYIQNLKSQLLVAASATYSVSANVSLTDPTVYNITIIATPPSNGGLQSLTYSISVTNGTTLNVLPTSINAQYQGASLPPLLYQGLLQFGSPDPIVLMARIRVYAELDYSTFIHFLYNGRSWTISMINGQVVLRDVTVQEKVNLYIGDLKWQLSLTPQWATYNVSANVSLTDPTVYNVTITATSPVVHTGALQSLTYSFSVTNNGTTTTINVLPTSINAQYYISPSRGVISLPPSMLYQGLLQFGSPDPIVLMAKILVYARVDYSASIPFLYNGRRWTISMINGQVVLQ